MLTEINDMLFQRFHFALCGLFPVLYARNVYRDAHFKYATVDTGGGYIGWIVYWRQGGFCRCQYRPISSSRYCPLYLVPMLNVSAGVFHLRRIAVVVLKIPRYHSLGGETTAFNVFDGIKVFSALLGGLAFYAFMLSVLYNTALARAKARDICLFHRQQALHVYRTVQVYHRRKRRFCRRNGKRKAYG